MQSLQTAAVPKNGVANKKKQAVDIGNFKTSCSPDCPLPSWTARMPLSLYLLQCSQAMCYVHVDVEKFNVGDVNARCLHLIEAFSIYRLQSKKIFAYSVPAPRRLGLAHCLDPESEGFRSPERSE